jgi:hypothetical protein
MSDLLRRHAATTATLKKYRDKPFDWRRGYTCVHLARYHLRQLGHRPPTMPQLRSAISARRAMDERGWSSVADMLDSFPWLTRIAPAFMTLGDLVVGPADEHFGAIGVCAGPHKLLGWQEDAAGMVVVDFNMSKLEGAWRV